MIWAKESAANECKTMKYVIDLSISWTLPWLYAVRYRLFIA